MSTTHGVRSDDNGTAPTKVSRSGPSSGLGRSNNGVAPERVAQIQRARMLSAMAEVACERGAASVTVADVVQRAGVSRRTFYEVFCDVEDCLLAAVDEALARASERALPAYREAGRWHERMRVALAALLTFLDEQPHWGRVLIVETLGSGSRLLARRTNVLCHVISAVQAAEQEAKPTAASTRLTAEGVVGAVLSVIHGRLLEDRSQPLAELLNPLMSMVVMPYLGPAAARRELERAPIQAAAHSGPPEANPLKDLHMRLTYRTVRVLGSVAASPGSSNRVIGDAAGIHDQGQVSKLLSRLERLGLIAKAGGVGRGEPNAWALTQRGEAVHATIDGQRG